MEVLVALGILIGLPSLFILPYWTVMSLEDWTDSPHLDAMEKWNILNLVYLPYKKIMSIDFKPKTSLDREIAEEEKEIKFLTEQKAKIDRLNTLKSEKDRLYQEVNMDFYRCKECGGTKVSGFHFYDRRLGQHIPVSYCSDCGTPIN